MTAYILRRLLSALLTLLGVAVILFVLFRMMPGDPTAQIISPALDAAAQDRLKQAFGLDLPVWQQFIIYLKNTATLEWGRSFTTGQPYWPCGPSSVSSVYISGCAASGARRPKSTITWRPP